jgi:hypothetical protein
MNCKYSSILHIYSWWASTEWNGHSMQAIFLVVEGLITGTGSMIWWPLGPKVQGNEIQTQKSLSV